MARNSFAGQVLATIKNDIGQGVTFKAKDVAAVLDVKSYAEIKKVPGALHDLSTRNALVKIDRGVFRLPEAGEKKPKIKNKQDRMWSILKMRGVVSAADLQELCDVTYAYAHEYLNLLVKREAVKALKQPKNQPWKYQLIKRDIIEPPHNTAKAERLREQRRKTRRKAAEKLEKATRNYYRVAVDLHSACEAAVAALQADV